MESASGAATSSSSSSTCVSSASTSSTCASSASSSSKLASKCRVGEALAAGVLAQTLWAAQEELRAYLLHFLEVSAIGQASATGRVLHECLWQDAPFWRAYAGPSLDAAPATSTAAQLRNIFRKWLFHLDGDWVKGFREFKDEASRGEFGADFRQLLADARYMVSGLMPSDDKMAVQDFVQLLCTLLSEYSPAQLDERGFAEALVVLVERRNDVFTEAQAKEVALVYEQSVERAILDQNLEDRDSNNDLFYDPDLEYESGEDGFRDDVDWETPGLPPPPTDDADSLWREGAGVVDDELDAGGLTGLWHTTEAPPDWDSPPRHDDEGLSFWQDPAPSAVAPAPRQHVGPAAASVT